MADWHLAPALDGLRREILARWPGTTIGSHATSGHIKGSDHYPDAGGQVNAIDVHTTGAGAPDGDRLVAQLVGDDRLAYVIWNRTIWSKSHGWQPRPYSGANPHTGHVHVSYDKGSSTGSGSGGEGGWFSNSIVGRVLPDVDLNPLDNVGNWLKEHARGLLITGLALAGGAALVVLGANAGVQPAVRRVLNV